MSPFQVWVRDGFRDDFREDSLVYLIESLQEHLCELGWPAAFAERLVERCLRDYAVSQAPASLLASAVVDVLLQELLQACIETEGYSCQTVV